MPGHILQADGLVDAVCLNRIYQAISSQHLHYHGLQLMAGEEENVAQNFPRRLTRANMTWEEAKHTAMDRPVWCQAAAQCAYWHRGTAGNKTKT